MKRTPYLKPACSVVPLITSSRVMAIETSLYTPDTFGKETEFEEEDDSNGFGNGWNYDFGSSPRRSPWDDLDDFKDTEKK